MTEERSTSGASSPLVAPQLKCIELFGTAAQGEPVFDRLEVTINFHPDRLTSAGVPLLEAIADAGVLKSQFETGTSNGGMTAFPGGGRWEWESRAFNGAYDDCVPSVRPKYGALNFKKLGAGGSPRFGSSFFKLKTELLDRITFCYPESFFGPQGYGAGSHVGHLIALADADDRDLLDHYIEAHVHGTIEVHNDIEALVLDPSYPDYRGIEIVRLGQAIAVDGWLTPRVIGQAVNAGVGEPQGLKKVWHYLARFGDLNH